MAQDPWKRAHQIKRLREQQAREQAHASRRGAGPLPAGRRAVPGLQRRSAGPAVAAWLMLGILLFGAAAAWYFRASWLPGLKRQVIEEAPALRKAAEAIPEERVSIDVAVLDSGLGLGLRAEGDYLEMLALTREHDPGWKVTGLGGDNARLTAPGVVVKVVAGRIQNYEISLEQLFASEAWQPWLPALREAHITPGLSYASLTGEETTPADAVQEYELEGQSIKRSDGWIRPIYLLHFRNGELQSLELAIRFGVADPSIEPRDAPSPSPDPAAAGAGQGG